MYFLIKFIAKLVDNLLKIVEIDLIFEKIGEKLQENSKTELKRN
jgi:hypothetical protein